MEQAIMEEENFKKLRGRIMQTNRSCSMHITTLTGRVHYKGQFMYINVVICE